MITKQELINKIKEIEWEDFEVKKAKNSVPKNCWETVSAFANTKGGCLIFGIEEIDKKIFISGVNNPEKIHNDFITTLRSEKFNTAFSAKGIKKRINSKTVLVYYIPEMPRQAKPIYFNEIRNTFIRYGGTDQRATKKEIEKFLREASESSSDSMVFNDTTIDDLRKDSIERFVNLFRSVTQNTELATLNPEQLLIRKGFLRKQKNDIKITAAAILQFGTDTAITKYFPYYKVNYFEIPGTKWGGVGGKRWDFPIRSESNLFETYQMIIPRLRIRVPVPFAFKEDGITREESSPALVSIKEAFVNLLVHTDYFDRKGASIKVYDNRIEMMNGGALLFDERLLKEGDISEPRNPIIIRAFRMIDLAEDAGSGFLKIMTNWGNAGFIQPEMESDRRENYFKIVFRSETISKKVPSKHPASTQQGPSKYPASTQQVNTILKYCLKPKSRAEIQNKLNLKDREYFRSAILKPLIIDGLLTMTIPDNPKNPKQKYITSTNGKKWIKDSEDYSERKEIAKVGTKLGPSWDQAGTKLVPRLSQACPKIIPSEIAAKILFLTQEPVSILSLMEAVKRTHRTHFRKNFIIPLIEFGYIERTIPDKPKSPNQKYVITENGKKLLKGLK